jgi:hypothetical protein
MSVEEVVFRQGLGDQPAARTLCITSSLTTAFPQHLSSHLSDSAELKTFVHQQIPLPRTLTMKTSSDRSAGKP